VRPGREFIGTIAGGDPKRLKKALLLIPSASAIMVIVVAAIRPMLAAH